MWLAYDRRGESPSLLTMTVGVEWNCLGRVEKVWRLLEVRIVVLKNISCEGWTRGPYIDAARGNAGGKALLVQTRWLNLTSQHA